MLLVLSVFDCLLCPACGVCCINALGVAYPPSMSIQCLRGNSHLFPSFLSPFLPSIHPSQCLTSPQHHPNYAELCSIILHPLHHPESLCITLYHPTSQITTRHHILTPRSTTQHHAAPRSTTQHHAAPRSTTQHYAALRSTTQHYAAPRSTI